MAAIPTLTLKDLLNILQREEDRYPFYGVLIYPPLNGLNQKLREYVVRRWQLLNDLTGYNALLVVIEDINRGKPIDTFEVGEVYAVARELGAPVDAVPCLVLFADARHGRDTVTIRLRDLVPETASDSDLTGMFQRLQTIIDACADQPREARLDCFWEALQRSTWEGETQPTGSTAGNGDFGKNLASGATVLESLAKILTVFGLG